MEPGLCSWQEAQNVSVNGFGALDVTKPYEFIGFGAIDVTKPYELIRFGAIDVTEPYELLGFGAKSVSVQTRASWRDNPPLGSAMW